MNRLTTHSVLKNAAAVVLALSGIAASAACSSAWPSGCRNDQRRRGRHDSVPNHSIVITGAFADSGTYTPRSSGGTIELDLSKGRSRLTTPRVRRRSRSSSRTFPSI